MRIFKTILIVTGILLLANICEAGVVPRFVSLKSNEVNLRTGPSKNYPITWVIRNKGEPVEVITEFEQWREIKDKDGDNGWVHESMLSGNRYAIVTGGEVQCLYRGAEGDKKVARLEPGVRAKLLTCKESRCYVSVEQHKGWIARDKVWGVYSHEKFD